MSKKRVCLAVDLGAGSGRVVAGIYDGARLEFVELNRFPNDPVKEADGWHWNLERPFHPHQTRHRARGEKIWRRRRVRRRGYVGRGLRVVGRRWEIVVRAVSISRQPHAGNAGRSLSPDAAKGNLSADGHPVHVFQHPFSTAGRDEFTGAAGKSGAAAVHAGLDSLFFDRRWRERKIHRQHQPVAQPAHARRGSAT